MRLVSSQNILTSCLHNANANKNEFWHGKKTPFPHRKIHNKHPNPIFASSKYGRAWSKFWPWLNICFLPLSPQWLDAGNFRTSPRAKPKALLHWHTEDYLQALIQAETVQSVSEAVRERHKIGTHNNPVFPEIWRRPATSRGRTSRSLR